MCIYIVYTYVMLDICSFSVSGVWQFLSFLNVSHFAGVRSSSSLRWYPPDTCSSFWHFSDFHCLCMLPFLVLWLLWLFGFVTSLLTSSSLSQVCLVELPLAFYTFSTITAAAAAAAAAAATSTTSTSLTCIRSFAVIWLYQNQIWLFAEHRSSVKSANEPLIGFPVFPCFPNLTRKMMQQLRPLPCSRQCC